VGCRDDSRDIDDNPREITVAKALKGGHHHSFRFHIDSKRTSNAHAGLE